MSMRKNLFLVLLCFLSVSLVGLAQPGPGSVNGMGNLQKNGKIKGRLIDGDSKVPMEYANVAIYKQGDGTLVTGGIGDVNGAFEIGNIPYGVYYVEANFIGYDKTMINDIKISPDKAVINLGDILLKPITEQLGTVEVVADRDRIQYKIDKKVINVSQDINAAGGTAVDVLQNTPSVDVDIEGNVSLRGSSNFTVLIDGKPSVLSGSDALKQIPSSAIQNIEIITNPSVKYDPDGVGGIINLVMKKNIISGFDGIVNVNVGTGDKYRSDMTLNYKTKKYNLSFGANWNDNTFHGKMNSERETWGNDTTTYLITNGKRNFSRNGYEFKGGMDYFLTEKTSVTVGGSVGHYGFEQTGGGKTHNYTIPADLDVYSNQISNGNRSGNYVSADASFSSKFDNEGNHKLEGSFNYRHRTGSSYDTDDEFLTDQNYVKTGGYLSRVRSTDDETDDEYRFKLDYTKPLADGGKFEAGLQSRIERSPENYIFENWDEASGTWENNDLYTSSMGFKRDIHAAYTTFSSSLGGFQYMVGLRGEYTNRQITHTKATEAYKINRADLFPSMHVSYNLPNEAQLMASYSRRINRPHGRDLDPFRSYMDKYTIRTGNPALKPEYTDSYELNYMHKFKKGSFLSVEGFYRATNNLISQVQTVGTDGIYYLSTTNMNNDYSLGTEVMGNIDIVKWLQVNTSFSLYDYRLKGQLNGASIDRESTNYTARLNTTVKFPDASRMQLMASYSGPTVSAQGDRSGMFFTNLSYRKDFMKRKLSVTASVRDIFGSMKMESNSYGDNFRSHFNMKRESRVFELTLSYKINNYKMDKNQNMENRDDNSFDDAY